MRPTWPTTRQAYNYALFGALFGALFPIVATCIEAWRAAGEITPDSLLAAQARDPLLWIINTAPFFLGLFASFGGRQIDILRTQQTALRGQQAALHRAFDEMQALKEHAEQASAAKGRFLATMSHEIRTPMNAVIAATGLLVESPLDDRQTELAHIVLGSGEALLALVNDVLDFSKIEAGELRLESVPVDVRACVHELAAGLRLAADAKGLTLDVRIHPDLPRGILGDGSRLRQVLVNLVSNAIKFTDRGGVIVTAEPDPPDRLRFTVTDTGIGIAPAHIAGLFDAFVQADTSTTRAFGGTGLGLTICKRLVEAMGGDIAVRSAPGRGSTFVFTLSATAVDLPPRRPLTPLGGVARARAEGDDVRILVAEDNPVNQRVLRLSMARLGYDVTVVDDGADAVSAVSRDAYDLILMDLDMPRLDGLMATRQVRARVGRGPYIVAVTANATAEARDRCAEAGMNDFVSKPVRLEDLERLLDRFEAHHRSA